MRVTYQIFRSWWPRYEKMCDEAAQFASQIGPERLINITTEEGGAVTVWYWSDEEKSQEVARTRVDAITQTPR